MGHSEKTTNFQLPIITDSDKPTWRGDFNAAMRILDDKAGGSNTQVSAALALATEAKADASNALGRALGVESQVAGIKDAADRLADVDTRLQTTLDTATAAHTTARNAGNDASAALVTATGLENRVAGVEAGLSNLSGRVLDLEGGGGGGGGGGVSWAKRARLKTNHVAISSNERWRTVECNSDVVQTDGTGGLNRGGISVPASGVYRVTAALTANLMNSPNDMQLRIGISTQGSDAEPVSWVPMHRSDGSATRLYTGTITDLVSASAGGTIYMVTLAPNTSATPIAPSGAGTMLIVERIS